MKWVVLLFLFSCTQVTSLNLKRHEFGIQPSKIIWYQVAGLEEEQIAMLRFNKSAEVKTAFEQTTCIGKSWAYNYYDLRSTAEATFMSQMTGSKNIKSECSDLDSTPVWKYLQEADYKVGLVESYPNKNQSLEKYKECENVESLKNISYWKRSPFSEKNKTFHYTESIPLNKKSVYFDRTCNENECLSSLKDNVVSITKELDKNSERYLFIVRDFSYLKAIQEKNYSKAKKILVDIEASFEESLKRSANSSDYLVLLSSGESHFVEFPDQGKDWYWFEKKNTKLQTKRSKLMNVIFASGSRAENFCGIYEDREIFERILISPKQQGLEFKFINPFKL